MNASITESVQTRGPLAQSQKIRKSGIGLPSQEEILISHDVLCSSYLDLISRPQSSAGFSISENVLNRNSLTQHSQNVYETRDHERSLRFVCFDRAFSSIHDSFSTDAQTQDKLTYSRMIPHTRDLPFTASHLCSFSFSAPDILLTNVDRTSPLGNLFSELPDCEREVCAKQSEGSGVEAGSIGISIGGTIGGLLVVIVAVILAIVIRRNRCRSEAVDEGKSGVDIGGMVEIMTVFEASDHYVSEENTDQVPREELIRLSLVAE
jgi:hypothetical protein